MKPESKTSPVEAQLIAPELLRSMPLPEYADDANKADYGKLLVIAGSARLPGAAILAARAALRSGCGTVRVAAPRSVAIQIGVHVPELMVIPLPETDNGTIAAKAWDILEKQFAPCDAVVLGPGLDEDEQTADLSRRLIEESPLPTLVDAQALLAYAQNPTAGKAKAARVWTPHEAEMLALLNQKTLKDSREITATQWAKEHQSTLVLKGKETLIAGGDGAIYKNTAGTRGLGTAGSGDVLAGIIGGLLAQGMDATHAAVYGVHIHALAGEAAEKDMGDDGMMARDFLERIPFVVRYLRKQVTPKKATGMSGLRPVN
jgi:NAD(P)H-hydrate epimerase